MSLKHYILNENNEPIAVDLETWAKWFETAERHVAITKAGDVSVSTVFLGLDHNWGEGPPILWETMIFGGENNEYQSRYSSYLAALDGHINTVAAVEEGKKLVF